MFASAGKSLNLYALERGGIKPLSNHIPINTTGAEIKQISWCYDNSYVAILPENEYPEILCVKDPRKLTAVHTLSAIPDITAIQFKSDTKRILALGCRNGQVVLYNTKIRCVSKVLGPVCGQVTEMEFKSAHELAVISDKDLTIFNLIIDDDLEVATINLDNPDVCSVMKCMKKNRDEIAVGCIDGSLIVWDTLRKVPINCIQAHSAKVTSIIVANKDKLIVTSGMDHKICLIASATGEFIFRKILHQPVTAIDMNTKEDYLVAGLQDGSIYLYHLADHLKPQICTKVQWTPINRIAFIRSPSGAEIESVQSLEKDSFPMESDYLLHDIAVTNVADKQENTNLQVSVQTSTNDPVVDANKEEKPVEIVMPPPPKQVSEEHIKSEIVKLINSHFVHLEDQLAQHCGKLQTLVSNELDALYAVAARWECFKTMEMEEIVSYICGIASGNNETKASSEIE